MLILASRKFCVVSLSDLSPKDYRFCKWKRGNLELADFYAQTSLKGDAERLRSCCADLSFQVDSEGKLRLYSARLCKHRFCQICNWLRRRKLSYRCREALDRLSRDYPELKWLFLTLAVRNCKPTRLRSTMEKMKRAWKKLAGNGTGVVKRGVGKYWCALGAIRTFEVTRKVLPDGSSECHPHIHALLAMPPEYGKWNDKLWIPQQNSDEYPNPGWVEQWQQALGVSYRPTAHVKYVGQDGKGDQRRKLMKNVREVIKYATKPTDLKFDKSLEKIGGKGTNARYLETVTEQLHKARLIENYGLMRKYLRPVKDDDDLIHVDDNSKSSEGLVVSFKWAEFLGGMWKFVPEYLLMHEGSIVTSDAA